VSGASAEAEAAGPVRPPAGLKKALPAVRPASSATATTTTDAISLTRFVRARSVVLRAVVSGSVELVPGTAGPATPPAVPGGGVAGGLTSGWRSQVLRTSEATVVDCVAGTYRLSCRIAARYAFAASRARLRHHRQSVSESLPGRSRLTWISPMATR